MKIFKYFLIAAISLTVFSCGNEPQPHVEKVVTKDTARIISLDNIKKMETEMHKSMQLDPIKAGLAIEAYADFTKNFPDDSLTPDFIFKTSEINTAIQQYAQALSGYQTITSKYPNYKLYPESLYLQAYLLDNFLNEDAKAKPIYEEVIAKYPTLSYAADAKAAINNLGKTDEELIKEFEKKNKK